MTQTILAIFNEADEGVKTARAWRREGIASVEVLSEEPIHEAINDEEPKSRIGIFAALGGVVGAGAALWMTVGTAKRLPVNTGGVPINTPWAFAIIFEVGMLSAILAAFVGIIFEAPLARGRAMKDYDEAVTDHKVVLVAHCEDEASLQPVRDLLAQTNCEVREEGRQVGRGEVGSKGGGEERRS